MMIEQDTSPDSWIARNGVQTANSGWLGSNFFLLGQNGALGLAMIAGNLTNIIWGKSKTGNVSAFMINFAVGTYMGISYALAGQWLASASGTGLAFAMGCGIAENFSSSHYGRFLNKKPAPEDENAAESFKEPSPFRPIVDKIGYIARGVMQAPAKLAVKGAKKLQENARHTVREFGQNLEDVTQRPNFTASAFGTLPQMLYMSQGLWNADVTQTLIGASWLVFSVPMALSKPKAATPNPRLE